MPACTFSSIEVQLVRSLWNFDRLQQSLVVAWIKRQFNCDSVPYTHTTRSEVKSHDLILQIKLTSRQPMFPV